MEIRQPAQVDTVVGYTCDVCSQPCYKQPGQAYSTEYGVLRADWGYWSKNDQTTEECHLCEDCFAKVRDFIRSIGGTVRRFDHYERPGASDREA